MTRRTTKQQTKKTPSKRHVQKSRSVKKKPVANKVYYNPKTLKEIKRGGPTYNEIVQSGKRVPRSTKEELAILRIHKKHGYKDRLRALKPTKFEIENRGMDLKPAVSLLKQLMKDPLFKQIANTVMDLIMSVGQTALSGALTIASVGMGGDTFSDVAFAVADTVISGLDTILSAPEMLTQVTGVDFRKEYLPFNEDINLLRQQYIEKWRRMDGLDVIRNNITTIMKEVARLIATWVSSISGWMSVIVPDDAGATNLIFKNVVNIGTTALLTASDEKLIQVFSDMSTKLTDAFIKVAKISDQRLKILNKVQEMDFSKFENKLKLIPAKYRNIIIQTLSSPDESNYVNEKYGSNVQRATGWLAFKSARLFDEFVKETNDTKVAGLRLPKFVRDKTQEFADNIKLRAPDVVSGVFLIISLIIGVLALIEVAREDPRNQYSSETDSAGSV
jgi:hypothetical protein